MERMAFTVEIPWYEMVKHDFEKSKKGEAALYPIDPLRTPLYLDRDRIYYFQRGSFISEKQRQLNGAVIEQLIIDLNLLRDFVEQRGESDPDQTAWCLESLIKPRQRIAELIQIPFVGWSWSICAARDQYERNWRNLCQSNIQGQLP